MSIDNFEGRAMFNFCSMLKRSSWEKYNFNEDIPRCENQEWAFHFLEKGLYTTVISSPMVFYNNPFYNAKKDAWDYIILGKHVYP